MKVRNGFVSNSSSSSFIVRTCSHCMSRERKNLLLNIDQVIKAMKPAGWEMNDWSVRDCGDHVSFWTSLDNFSMARFLSNLGFTCEEFD